MIKLLLGLSLMFAPLVSACGLTDSYVFNDRYVAVVADGDGRGLRAVDTAGEGHDISGCNRDESEPIDSYLSSDGRAIAVTGCWDSASGSYVMMVIRAGRRFYVHERALTAAWTNANKMIIYVSGRTPDDGALKTVDLSSGTPQVGTIANMPEVSSISISETALSAAVVTSDRLFTVDLKSVKVSAANLRGSYRSAAFVGADGEMALEVDGGWSLARPKQQGKSEFDQPQKVMVPKNFKACLLTASFSGKAIGLCKDDRTLISVDSQGQVRPFSLEVSLNKGERILAFSPV
jgi:hypothetical protein